MVNTKALYEKLRERKDDVRKREKMERIKEYFERIPKTIDAIEIRKILRKADKNKKKILFYVEQTMNNFKNKRHRGILKMIQLSFFRFIVINCLLPSHELE